MERLLIVEGEEDYKFFSVLLRVCGHADVQIKYHPSGKQNAVKSFSARLALATLASKLRVGVVLDADFQNVSQGSGFVSTRAALNSPLVDLGFPALSQMQGCSGMVCAKGSVRVGAWIMPDNASDGLLEDLVVLSISHEEADRFEYASAQASLVVDRANQGPLFEVKSHHRVKAQVGTWLAWADPPRLSLGGALSRGLMDLGTGQIADLKRWLDGLFG